jgi:TolA-binding protein
MRISGIVLCGSLLVAGSVLAQPAVRLPDASPGASVGQTIGVTDIAVAYHRPAVNKRKIFGGLVQYGALWRAGANENTTISFSTPVKVEGQPLPAGKYGFFMIPGASQWTVVFSKFASDWGAYNYDPSEDALRVTVTPQTTAENQERMSFTFEDLTNNSANLAMRWEKTRVPVKIEVDVPATVHASILKELRGGKHWSSDAWAAAARWELRNGDLDTALQYANHALDLGATTGALRTKAAVLEKKGDAKAAAELRARAKQNYNEAEEVNFTAFGLIGDKKYDEAITYLTNYLSAHPNTSQAWRINYILGTAYGEKGDQAKARDAFEKAKAGAHDAAEREEVQDAINSLGAEGKL